MYNVLWIDDEWDKMPIFKKNCESLYNICLEPYRTRKDGINALEKDITHWDAVLLDAKMWDESENENASLTGLSKAINRLAQLDFQKALPRFIFTGQPGLLSDETFKESFGKFYVKNEDNERLIEDMLKAIAESDSRQIKVFYQETFSALESLKINDSVAPILTDILEPLHFPAKHPEFKPALHYNQLRQAIEYLFRACNKVGLVPDQCLSGGIVNLSQSSMYLAGKDAVVVNVRYGNQGDRIAPVYIESLIRSILTFGNTNSHTVELSEEDQIKINDILREKKSRFIVFGLAMQLCEIIIWLADYISKNGDKEKNLLMCRELPKDETGYEGKEVVPEQDEDGDWHYEQCSLPINHWDNGRMILTGVCENSNPKTNSKYPYFAYFKAVAITNPEKQE